MFILVRKANHNMDAINEGTLCLICNKGNYQGSLITEPVEYKGRQVLVHNCKVYKCSHCHEKYHSSESFNKIENAKKELMLLLEAESKQEKDKLLNG